MQRFKLLVISLMGLLWANMAFAVSLPGPIVETDWLEKNKSNVVILDIRKDVKSFTKKPVFKKSKNPGKMKLKKIGGHIPGANLVNYKKLRASKKINGLKIIKLILSKSAFEKMMQSAGVNKDSAVVIVSKGKSNKDMTMATRLYWTMKYYGHDNMGVLNGGMAQWIVDKRKVSSKKSKAKKGNWVATAARDNILATSQDVEQGIKDKTQLVDTRSMSLYLGTWRKKSYVFANGHIPGAKPFPNEMVTTGMPAKFLTAEIAKSAFSGLGINPDKKSIAYCNSGHLATGSWFLMSEVLGNKNVKMYDGSMHQWTKEKRPVTKMKME